MQKFLNRIDQMNTWIGKQISWLSFILVLIICFDVFLRYFFSNTKVWIIELEWHLFALLFLLASAYTLVEEEHVRVDVFYAKFSKKKKAWINLLGGLFFLIPWCLMIVISSNQYAQAAFEMNEGSPNPGGLPWRFIIKYSITFGFAILLIQAIASVLKALSVIIKKDIKG